MSVKSALFYSIECDYPDCTYCTQDIGEYSSWMDVSTAIEEWQDADGLVVENGPDDKRFYCWNHCMWDEEADERVPLPEGIEGEFILAERRIQYAIYAATERALTRHLKRCSDWQLRDAVTAAKRIEAERENARLRIAETMDVPAGVVGVH